MRDARRQLPFVGAVLALAAATAAAMTWAAPAPTSPAATQRSAPATTSPSTGATTPSAATPTPTPTSARTEANPALVARGRTLFAERCSACHGPDGRGEGSSGPSLVGVGAASVDFMLSTGRMPLDHPSEEPERAASQYGQADRAALVAFIASLGAGGPAIPRVDAASGDLERGRALFADRCSGCHQIVAEGGVGPGFRAPSLERASATQIGEAIRSGPYVMPSFSRAQLSDRDVNAIARYVTTAARHPRDAGGWGIGHIGPIPEGLVAILIGGLAILWLTRLIGERR